MFRGKDINGEPKYIARTKAIVIDNRDPQSRGRVRVITPLHGETPWIDYLFVPGHFSVPSINDIVYVECDTGEEEYMAAWGNLAKGERADPETPARFKRTIPTNRGLHTPNGHFFEMDDGLANVVDAPDDTQYTTESRGVRLTTKAGNKIHIAEDTDGGIQHILLEDVNGNLIKLDYKDNHLTINSVGTTQFDTASNRDDTVGGNKTQVVTGNKTETVNGNRSETVQGTQTENITGAQSQTIGGALTITVTGAATIVAEGDVLIKSTGSTTVEGADITLKSVGNSTAPGGVVTDNVINNDPITGIPLVPVGSTTATP